MVMYSDTRHIQTEIPVELHKKLRRFCVDHELTLTILLSQIVTEWINKNITLKEVKHGQEENE